jgi:hypothetical protein
VGVPVGITCVSMLLRCCCALPCRASSPPAAVLSEYDVYIDVYMPCSVDTIALACYAVRRRRVLHLGVSLRQGFMKGVVTMRWASAELLILEGELARVTPDQTWSRAMTLQVIVVCCLYAVAYGGHSLVCLCGYVCSCWWTVGRPISSQSNHRPAMLSPVASQTPASRTCLHSWSYARC